MPERIENTLLVVDPFKAADGREWRPGDGAPLQHRSVRKFAKERPEAFRLEFETAEFSPSEPWFVEADRQYEAHYLQAKKARDGEKERREQALRRELKEQGRHDPDLERRFKQQEQDRAEREKQAREERERERLEAELSLAGLRSGFHYE